MLVLTRKKNESIIIAGGIEITITDICGNKVRIGVNAPRHIQVYRKEIQPFSDYSLRDNEMAISGSAGIRV